MLGLPIAVDMLILKKKYRIFAQWSVISAIVILVPMTIIDSMHFGKIVIAPLNIIKYNIFSGTGPNLYGTEPYWFYLVNGFLNFNFVWVSMRFVNIKRVPKNYTDYGNILMI